MLFVLKHDFHRDISNDIGKWFDTSNYSKDIDRPLEKGKNKKVIGKFKDELGGRVMSEFVVLDLKHMHFKLMVLLMLIMKRMG